MTGEKIKYIAEHNGIEKVYTKLAEECSEYAAAHLKILAGEGDTDTDARYGELADIMLLIDQLGALFTEDEKALVLSIVEQKADRRIKQIQENIQKGPIGVIRSDYEKDSSI